MTSLWNSAQIKECVTLSELSLLSDEELLSLAPDPSGRHLLHGFGCIIDEHGQAGQRGVTGVQKCLLGGVQNQRPCKTYTRRQILKEI